MVVYFQLLKKLDRIDCAPFGWIYPFDHFTFDDRIAILDRACAPTKCVRTVYRCLVVYRISLFVPRLHRDSLPRHSPKHTCNKGVLYLIEDGRLSLFCVRTQRPSAALRLYSLLPCTPARWIEPSSAPVVARIFLHRRVPPHPFPQYQPPVQTPQALVGKWERVIYMSCVLS